MLVLCSECEREISDKAKACPHCGIPVQHWTEAIAPETTVQQVVVHNSSNPGVAALLSIVIPGLGQLYKGQPANGIVWFILVIVCYAGAIPLGVLVHIACILGAAARKKPKQPKASSAASASRQSAVASNHQSSLDFVDRYRFAIAGVIVLALVVMVGANDSEPSNALSKEAKTADTSPSQPTEAKRVATKSFTAVRKSPPRPTPPANDSEPTTDYWVTADKLSRRTCPSTDCGVVGSFSFGDVAQVRETDAGWARVSYFYDAYCDDGVVGYVQSGRSECVAANGVAGGQISEWVSADYLANENPNLSSAKAPSPLTSGTPTRHASLNVAYTPQQLNRMINAGNFPEQGDPTSTDSQRMDFAECLIRVNAVMTSIREHYPVKTIVDTAIVYVSKAWTNDGVVMATCSEPDSKMVLTRSAYL